MRVTDVIETLDRVAASVGESDPNRRHPILDGNCSAEYIYRKSHDSYTPEDLDIELTHREPQTASDRAALWAVKLVRGVFDTATGWSNNNGNGNGNGNGTTPIHTQNQVLNRVIFLETVAAVPGMVAAVARHFRSLRRMERDWGLLHLFLEEANNERMHLLSFVRLKDPGTAFRGAVVVSQFGFATAFFLAYVVAPKFCHRFVGYIEEEACHTYTNILKAVEKAPPGSELEAWKTQRAPAIARAYWKLGDTGTVLDLLYAVRADEAEHRDVHHACGNLPHNHSNLFPDPDTKVHELLRKYVEDIMSQTSQRGDRRNPGSGDTKLAPF
eukprot:jgi/Psemu1/253737/estExt_Genewise1Plus.C_770008